MTATILPVVRFEPGTALPGADDGTAPVVALAGFRVTWGRIDPLEQAEPATATVTLWTRDRRYAIDKDLTGLRMVIETTGGLSGTQAVFVGRIAEVVVRPVRRNGVDGALVDLTLMSWVTDLANKQPGSSWPEETATARAARLTVSTALSTVTLPAAVTNRPLAPVALADQMTHLEHLQTLFDAAGGETWQYDPALLNPNVYPSPRRVYSGRGLAGLTAHPTDGVIIAAGSFGSPYGVMGLPASKVGYDTEADGVTRTSAQKISAARVAYKRAASTPAYAAAVVERAIAGVSEAITGERLAALDTLITTDAGAGLAADELVDRVTKEGTLWRLAPMSWRGATFPFDDVDWQRLFLQAREFEINLFVSGTVLPSLGLRPVVAVIGGDISWSGEEWEVIVSPMLVVTTAKQHAVTLDEAGAVKVYTDGLFHADALNPSITPDDLFYCSTGLGAASPGPDQGWDTYR